MQQSIQSGVYVSLDNVPSLIALIESVVNYSVSFFWNMDQSWGANDPRWNDYSIPGNTGEEKSDYQMGLKQIASRQLLRNSKIIEILPTGTAVQDARTTNLKQYGDQRYLVKDNAGHLQAGAGTLVASLCAAYKILDYIGSKLKTKTTFDPIDAVLSEYNISRYLPSVGVGPENLTTIEKCAVIAYHNPFEIIDCS